MKRPFRQSSFAAGEIDPELHARNDLDRYASGAAVMRNVMIASTGVANGRMGTERVRESKDSSARCRLVPFEFSREESCAMEFGDGYIRFHKDGGTVEDPLSPGNPYEIESPYTTADLAELDFAQLNDIVRITSEGHHPYELKRYAEDSWQICLASTVPPVKAPGTPSFLGTWTTADTTHPAQEWDWVVTAVDATGRESVASAPYQTSVGQLYSDRAFAQFSTTAPTVGNAPVSYNWYRGRNAIYGRVGESKTLFFTDEGRVPDYGLAPPTATDPFVKKGTEAGDATPRQATFAAGVAQKAEAAEAVGELYNLTYNLVMQPGDTARVTIETEVTNGAGYSVYGADAEYFAPPFQYPGGRSERIVVPLVLTGMLATANFKVTLANSTGSPFLAPQKVEWSEAGAMAVGDVPSYPARCCFYEQRLVYGGGLVEPSTIKMSQTDSRDSHDRSSPARADDAIVLQLASKKLNAIRFLVPLKVLIVGTAGGEWVVMGADGYPITPDSFDLDQETENGSSTLVPLVIGNAVLFATERGNRVRQMIYQPGVQGGDMELSIFSRHLFKGKQIEEWAYARSPNEVVWAQMSDGEVNAMTYKMEHDIWGWSRLDTKGEIESVCSIPEGRENRVYLSVKRTINGQTKRFIERVASEEWVNVEDAVCVDCSLSYDGRNSGATTITAFGATYAAADSVTLTASSAEFSAADVGRTFRFRTPEVRDRDGTITTPYAESRFRVTVYTSTTEVTAECVNPTDPSHQNVAFDLWARGANTLTGLGHLEGEEVSLAIDGTDGGLATVASGEVTLDTPGYLVHVGLPYRCELESLPLWIVDFDRDGRIVRKIPKDVYIELRNWKGLKVGSSFETLYDIDRRDVDEADRVPEATTGAIFKRIRGRWKRRASISLQQDAPLPFSVLSIVAGVEYGGE